MLPSSRRLRLIIREEEKHDNLFARLSPTTASNLHLLARRSSSSSSSRRDPVLSKKSNSIDERPKDQCKRNPNESSEDSWIIPDEEENNNSISFLPLLQFMHPTMEDLVNKVCTFYCLALFHISYCDVCFVLFLKTYSQ
jgi:hypothetical protein